MRNNTVYRRLSKIIAQSCKEELDEVILCNVINRMYFSLQDGKTISRLLNNELEEYNIKWEVIKSHILAGYCNVVNETSVNKKCTVNSLIGNKDFEGIDLNTSINDLNMRVSFIKLLERYNFSTVGDIVYFMNVGGSPAIFGKNSVSNRIYFTNIYNAAKGYNCRVPKDYFTYGATPKNLHIKEDDLLLINSLFEDMQEVDDLITSYNSEPFKKEVTLRAVFKNLDYNTLRNNMNLVIGVSRDKVVNKLLDTLKCSEDNRVFANTSVLSYKNNLSKVVVFYKRFYLNQTWTEIAAEFGVSTPTIKNWFTSLEKDLSSSISYEVKTKLDKTKRKLG